jgi:hypothetical protein
MRLPVHTLHIIVVSIIAWVVVQEVSGEGCYVSPSTLGVMEGSIEYIRDGIIERLPKRAQEQFPWGKTNGVFVKPVKEGELPVYAFMVHLVCYEPVSEPDDDMSSLIVAGWEMTLKRACQN